ncbi:MAG: methylenetetrahydrofolate reductase [NAD(P)H] [Pseudomonadota bacterium]
MSTFAYDGPPPQVSFEVFPPKTDKGRANLWTALERLDALGPAFYSVTYGAGGGERDRTQALVSDIQAKLAAPAAAHLTCVGAPRSEIDAIADAYWDAGVRHIVALRGDPPDGVGADYEPHPDGYAYAADLVGGLARRHPFDISVAAYPETHPQAPSADFDIENLKRKADAGATRAITQYFFDNVDYLRFRDRAAAAGVTIMLEPGVMPVANYAQVARFSAACGARVPGWMAAWFDRVADDPPATLSAGAAICAEQCLGLMREGVDAFHFYTLNKPDLTLQVCRMLGVRPKTAGAEAAAA